MTADNKTDTSRRTSSGATKRMQLTLRLGNAAHSSCPTCAFPTKERSSRRNNRVLPTEQQRATDATTACYGRNNNVLPTEQHGAPDGTTGCSRWVGSFLTCAKAIIDPLGQVFPDIRQGDHRFASKDEKEPQAAFKTQRLKKTSNGVGLARTPPLPL